jgi:RNA polymerase sigma-70 factor, ECF subfamily
MDQDFSLFDDEELLRLIEDGTHEAFAALVRRHTPRFYRVAYRLAVEKRDAEDIVQEAFLKLWERPTAWDRSRHTKFTTWFYRVVMNLCVDHNRKKKPLPFPEKLQPEDPRPGQDTAAEDRRRQVMLEALIQELPVRQQLALDLCFYEGLSNKEAAEVIGIKVKALQSLIMRAKVSLKEKIIRYHR